MLWSRLQARGSPRTAVVCTLFQGRLTPFESVLKSALDAQAQVDAADAKVSKVQAEVAEVDLDLSEGLEGLARRLLLEGAAMKNAFAKLDAPSLGALTKLASQDKAGAAHRLVASLQRDKHASKEALKAGQAVEKTAVAVEKAVAVLAPLQAAAREARHSRDALAEPLENARAALRRQVRFLDGDGHPGLFGSVFPFASVKRKSSKSSATKAAPSEAAATPAS